MDLLQSGLSWLTDQLKANVSQTVTYSRLDQYGRLTQSVTLQATLGSSLLKLDDGSGGFQIEHTDRDFLIKAGDLELGGVEIEPQRGDRVTVTTPDGATETYEVSPYGGDPPWRWSDPYHLIYRVHSRRVT